MRQLSRAYCNILPVCSILHWPRVNFPHAIRRDGNSTGLGGTSSSTASESSTSSSARTSSSSSSTSSIALASNTSPPTDQGSSGISGGAIAGIVIGALAGVVATVLAFLCMRRKRRRGSGTAGAVEPYQPHNTTSPSTQDISSPVLVGSGHNGDPIGMISEKRKPVIPSDSRSLDAPNTAAASSSTQVNNATTPGNLPAEMAETSSERNVNIQRLFEDRRFENELLSFLSQRMDPPPAHPREDMDEDFADSVAPPPTYRES